MKTIGVHGYISLRKLEVKIDNLICISMNARLEVLYINEGGFIDAHLPKPLKYAFALYI